MHMFNLFAKKLRKYQQWLWMSKISLPFSVKWEKYRKQTALSTEIFFYIKLFQNHQIIIKYTLEIIKMSCNTMNIAASSMKHMLMFLIIPVYLSIYTYMEMQ